MTIEGMEASQATRNEVIASVFGRIPVANVAGSDHRKYLMERRGDGVSIIRTETEKATGFPPEYEVVDESNLVLRIPAAKLDLVPADATVTVHARGEPLAGIEGSCTLPQQDLGTGDNRRGRRCSTGSLYDESADDDLRRRTEVRRLTETSVDAQSGWPVTRTRTA